MATVFTRIMSGELPGRFVWRDERCCAFLTLNPIRPGHTLVVPRREVDHWLDLEPALAAHVLEVAQLVGKAIQAAFGSKKVGLSIVGLEVPHAHLHLIPIDSMADVDFARQTKDPDARALDAAAEKIRVELAALGFQARAQAIR